MLHVLRRRQKEPDTRMTHDQLTELESKLVRDALLRTPESIDKQRELEHSVSEGEYERLMVTRAVQTPVTLDELRREIQQAELASADARVKAAIEAATAAERARCAAVAEQAFPGNLVAVHIAKKIRADQ